MMGSSSGLTYAQVAKKQHAALSTTKSACQSRHVQSTQPEMRHLAAANNRISVSSHAHSHESTASTTEVPSCSTHIASEGDTQSNRNAGARKRSNTDCDDDVNQFGRAARAERDAMPSRMQFAHNQEPRRLQMINTKPLGKQVGEEMTRTETKRAYATEPTKLELSETAMQFVDVWLQWKETQSNPVEQAMIAAQSVEPSPYDFRPRNGDEPLRTTRGTAQPEQSGSEGCNISEQDTGTIKSELLLRIDGSSSWAAPVKEEKKRLAGILDPRDKTESQKSLPRRSDVTSRNPGDSDGRKKIRREASGATTGASASMQQTSEVASNYWQGPIECGRRGHTVECRCQSISSTASKIHQDGFPSVSESTDLRQECHRSFNGGRFSSPITSPREDIRRCNSSAVSSHRPSSLPKEASRSPLTQARIKPWNHSTTPIFSTPFSSHQYCDNIISQHLKRQVEYYFSIENLCKDIYLRKRMDSQGFVDLHLVAAFKRVRDLTTDIHRVRAVCEASTEVEYIVRDDASERLRRRSNWQAFLLPLEDRDELRLS
ncbi:hypothetical protein ACCO45_009898 [Purpureocillium lilacinum]|uniref:Uncharacterized protein n=1 Tax=Purpureocillium lilacinum TaxID=33203 RepID=A0ACC4DHU8_PURLI